MNASIKRIYRSIINSIEEFKLDLSDETVLTELGTNEYAYVAFVPILANAKKVIIIYNDRRSYPNLKSKFLEFANEFKINKNSYLLLSKTELSEVKQQITIISNCGNVRPINQLLIQGMGNLKVVGLMYDDWELRESDIDIEYLTKKEIKLVAVNETHPFHDIFSYVGPLCAKLCLESKHEILNEKILVWSQDLFGESISKYLTKIGATEVILSTNIDVLIENIDELDIVILVDYNFEGEYFGINGLFDEHYIFKNNPSLTFVHIYGRTNSNGLIDIYPQKPGLTKKMSRTFSYLGYNPLFKLITGGYKVCEETIKNDLTSLSKPVNF